ncbi:MAG TPA: DUF2277 domain-containing protein, partial [Kofleriaceae bacterium]|nr:DUF2277 domain-containing protein [Kofleriaceae bacterium]
MLPSNSRTAPARSRCASRAPRRSLARCRVASIATAGRLSRMCRNIRVLFHFDPPTTPDEIQAAALQYVRKVSGSTKPAQVNQEAF